MVDKRSTLEQPYSLRRLDILPSSFFVKGQSQCSTSVTSQVKSSMKRPQYGILQPYPVHTGVHPPSHLAAAVSVLQKTKDICSLLTKRQAVGLGCCLHASSRWAAQSIARHVLAQQCQD